MAELLVYNRDHWSKDDPNADKDKFKSCLKKGDIIEVRENGYWQERNFRKDTFAVLIVPGLSKQDAEQFAQSEMKDGKLENARQFNIDMSKIVLNENKKAVITTLQIKDKKAK